MKAIFEQYVEDEAEKEEPPPPTRRKTPGGNYHDVRYEKTMTVDTSLTTGNQSYKRAFKATELQKYYDSIAYDLVETESKEDSPLFKDPLTWWLLTGRHLYPTLFKIALDFLSIPSTSYECERAFSGGRRTVIFDRNPLSGATIEALQLQKNWLRRRAVRSELTKLTDFLQT